MNSFVFSSSGDWLKRLMKRKEEETVREKRRVGDTYWNEDVAIPFIFYQDELKVKIDLEEQYANASKNTLAANIKKTVEVYVEDIILQKECYLETRFRCKISSSI